MKKEENQSEFVTASNARPFLKRSVTMLFQSMTIYILG